MKKRFLLLPLVSLAMLASCGGSSTPSPSQSLPSSVPSANTVTVTFDLGYDGKTLTQEVEKGAWATKPEDPSRDHYLFLDWVDENDDHWVFNGYSVHADITLYAVWQHVFDVTFDYGYEEKSSSQAVPDGEAVVVPTDASREGYSLIGWYDDEGNPVAPTATQDVTYHAVWWEESPSVDFRYYGTMLERVNPGASTVVRIPANTVSISSDAFSGNCQNVTDVFVPPTLSLYGCSVFAGISPNARIHRYLNGKEFTWSSYRCAGWSWPIYAYSIFGEPIDSIVVTEREKDNYSDCVNLQVSEVRFQEGVKEIPAEMFKGNMALRKVTFAESVQTIGYKAFAQTGLQEIVIPPTVLTIKGQAFSECPNLKKVEFTHKDTSERPPVIVESVDYVRVFAPKKYTRVWAWFREEGGDVNYFDVAWPGKPMESYDDELNCYSFTDVKGPLMVIVSINGFSQTADIALSGPGNWWLYQQSAERADEMPRGFLDLNTTSIQEFAFAHSPNLTEVYLSNADYDFSSGIFADCPKLNAFHVDKDSNCLDAAEGINAVLTKAGTLYALAHNAPVPQGTKEVWNCVFVNSPRQSIDFPDSVETIHDSMAFGCPNLRSITFGSGFNRIGKGYFGYVSEIDGTEPSAAVSFTIASLCPNLESINVSSANKYFASNGHNALVYSDPSLDIEGLLVLGCKTTVFGDDVKSIGCFSFYKSGLSGSIVLPSSVDTLENNAFDSTDIEEITIPSSVDFIYKDAFNNCAKLKKVYIDKPSGYFPSEILGNCQAEIVYQG